MTVMTVMAAMALMNMMAAMIAQYHPWIGGYSPFSTIEFDADDKISLFRESCALFLLYPQRNCP